MASTLPGVCQEKLKIVFSNAEKGSNNLLDFIDELHHLPSSGCCDMNSIETLLPKLDMSKTTFETMIRNLDDVLQIVNKEFEASVVKIKDKNDQLTLKNVKTTQIKISLNGKEEDVRNAEAQYKQKINELDTAESYLSSARQVLENAKKKQRDMQIAGGVLMAIPIFGTIAGSTLLAVSFTAEQDAVNSCEHNVNNSRSFLEDSNKDLQRASGYRQAAQSELNAIEREQASLNHEIRMLNEDMSNLKICQRDLIELNEKMKNYFRDVSYFHGRFKVMYSETRGAYSVSTLSGPIETVLTSTTELIYSTTTQSIKGTTRMVGLDGRIRQIKQLEWRVDDGMASINDLC